MAFDWKTKLADATVAEGDPVELKVEVQGGTPTYKYEWKKDGQAAPNTKDEPSYKLEKAKKEDAGSYSVTVTDSAKATLHSDGAQLKVTGAVAGPPQLPAPPPLWSAGFARGALFLVAVAFGICIWPLFASESHLFKSADFARLISVQLLVMSLLAVAGGVYLGLLEFRGRARTAEERQAEKLEAKPDHVSTKDWSAAVSEAAKAAPETLKAFGTLSTAAAIFVVGLVFAGCATALAWHATPSATPTGASGTTGSSGATGASGTTGASGAPGTSGQTGPSGTSGSSGATGASGASGK
jgi:hypothetical protein